MQTAERLKAARQRRASLLAMWLAVLAVLIAFFYLLTLRISLWAPYLLKVINM